MCFVQGRDFQVITDRQAINKGEFILIKPERKYYCQIAHLFEDENRNDDLCIYPDSDYSFYDSGLWRSKTRALYPKNVFFVFEHEVSNNIDINRVVEDGKANYLSKSALETFLEKSLKEGFVLSLTVICKSNSVVWKQVMRQRSIEIQMLLNRFLPEPALSRVIEQSVHDF